VLGVFTGVGVSTTIGDSGITDDGTTVNTTRNVTVTKSGIGTTKTAGLYSINATASGSQVSAQIGGSAKHSGGTQHNFGWQCEPQSAGRAIWRLCYGTGDPVSSPPASTGYTWTRAIRVMVSVFPAWHSCPRAALDIGGKA
jgi:hypothetical protein